MELVNNKLIRNGSSKIAMDERQRGQSQADDGEEKRKKKGEKKANH